MVFLRTDEERRRLLRGEEGLMPLPDGGGAEPATTTSLVDSSPDATVDATGTTVLPRRPFFGATSLEDLTGRLGRLSSDFAGVEREFSQALAQNRPQFGEAERGLFQQGVFGEAPLSQEELARARDILAAKERNIPQFGEAAARGIETEAEQIRGFGTSALSGRSFLPQKPGLTLGEQRFNLRSLGTRGAREQGRDIAIGAQDILGQVRRGRGAAQEALEQRARERQQVAEQARGLLGGFQGDIRGAAGERAAEVAKEFEDFARTGSIKELEEFAALLPEEQRAQLEPVRRGERLQAQAQQAFQGVMQAPQFAEIANIPLAQIRLDASGIPRRTIEFPDGRQVPIVQLLPPDPTNPNTGQAVFPGMTPQESQRLAVLINERQNQIDQLFAPASSLGPRGEFAGLVPEAALFGTEGAAGTVRGTGEPVAFTPTQPGGFIGFTPGQEFLSEEQAGQLNRIAELLGEEPGFVAGTPGELAIAQPEFEEAMRQRQDEFLAAIRAAEEAQAQQEGQAVSNFLQRQQRRGAEGGLRGGLTGALQGALAGSFLGPPGIVGGGILGGIQGA